MQVVGFMDYTILVKVFRYIILCQTLIAHTYEHNNVAAFILISRCILYTYIACTMNGCT